MTVLFVAVHEFLDQHNPCRLLKQNAQVAIAAPEILPRILRSPVEICLGTSPSRAPKSRRHDGATRIVAHVVERVLADIDTNHDDRGSGCLRHGVLLVFGTLASFTCWRGRSTAGPSHQGKLAAAVGIEPEVGLTHQVLAIVSGAIKALPGGMAAH